MIWVGVREQGEGGRKERERERERERGRERERERERKEDTGIQILNKCTLHYYRTKGMFVAVEGIKIKIWWSKLH